MSTTFTIHDLTRVLAEGAGLDASLQLGLVLDTDFASLGYDSLAMLETASRVEREFDVCLDESQIHNATTIQEFLDSVNGAIAEAV
ncbi:MAG: acyl carrier protein [Dermatophilaceae bacterium]